MTSNEGVLVRLSRIVIVCFLAFGWLMIPSDSASANGAWQSVSNGNVSGNSVQFDYRGGNASYAATVTQGSTVTVSINNTIANCIGNCAPIADTWSVSLNGQSFSGNTIESTTVSAVVSGQATINVSGIDNGFWSGWYGPIFTVSINSPTSPPLAPTNLVASLNPSTVTLTWDMPETGTAVERYAVFWSSDNWMSGRAVASMTGTITLSLDVIDYDGRGKDFSFKIRSDNDSLALYSDWSNVATIFIPLASAVTPTPTAEPSPSPTRMDAEYPEAAENLNKQQQRDFRSSMELV